jgi:hypothetical protein
LVVVLGGGLSWPHLARDIGRNYRCAGVWERGSVVIAAAAHMQDAAMPSDGRARWLGRDAFQGKLEGCLRGVVGRAHGFMGLSDPQRDTINGDTFWQVRSNHSININIDNAIYNFAFAGPSVSAFS